MDIKAYVQEICAAAKAAQLAIAAASGAEKNAVLNAIADALEARADEIIAANKNDLDHAQENGLAVTKMDRLMLDKKRISGIASSIREITLLVDPVGEGERWVRPNGLIITRVRVPIGTVGIIYEARPEVTVDAAAICIKSGNVCVLRGGKEAVNTNRILVELVQSCLIDGGFDGAAVSFIDNTERESSQALMVMRGYIDLLIPRGGEGLIRYVTENSTVPVIETGSGNCHLYVDETADLEMAKCIAVNAKTSRPSVCNSIETLLVHKSVAERFLPMFCEASAPWNVEIRGCEETQKIMADAKPATEDDYYREYNDYIIAVKIVEDIGEAIAHINKYNTLHSEAIVTRSMENAQRFKRDVDAAAVYVNASTRFTDGGEFGFGAEIGISNQKLHARGPMGLRELTTAKYTIDGSGQIR